jgi:Leucine-rich repeat (LRR) protein
MPHDPAYLLAEKKIEEALNSAATELDLSDMQLSELPASIGQLSRLQKLSLGHAVAKKSESETNQLFTLPESLSFLTQLRFLNISFNRFEYLPEWLIKFTQLESLGIDNNRLTEIPEFVGEFRKLHILTFGGNNIERLPNSLVALEKLRIIRMGWTFGGNPIDYLPEWLSKFTKLRALVCSQCRLTLLPDWIEKNIELERIYLGGNKLLDLPSSIVHLRHLKELRLEGNPLNPELAKAYEQGLDAVKTYLIIRGESSQVILNEAKLISVGEGEVGKTCLMDALLDKEWQEHPSTHGIEIQSFKVTNHDSQKQITLNGWDFGGQRVYRPTHQLFFSAPAVYLVVWKPREGPQQGFVKEWIQLVKRREPSAKIIIVATHGGPQQRQPDIDRQELRDAFGVETVVDFFFVDSKPDAHGNRKGIAELKEAIARVAATLPEVGRSVPKSFADVRLALQATGAPYLPLDEVLAICRAHHMDDEIARLFITISHRLGHLTHYENDPVLRDIVILRPDWLASAMSYVLDDEETRNAHGLVDFSRLGHLWDDPSRPADTRYPATLHRIFLRLMERFDLSYRVADPAFERTGDSRSRPYRDPFEIYPDTKSLIAQLVPDTTPKEDKFNNAWTPELASGDIQQTQICRIVDAGNGQSANAEGLFYQLIVRLHRYSLGRVNYNDSVHWQRGLILDANYNGRALLRHIGNDVHITVRAAFPERFLGMLTEEVKYLVESFWEGLRCDVTVPCIATPECKGLFEVSKLIENKRRDRHEQPCPICNEWQSIEQLLSNAPAATATISLDSLMKEFAQVKDKLDEVNDNTKRILSQVDKQYADLIQLFTDEAKEGPRLFSLFPLDGSKFNPKNWIRHQFRLVLWCEHSRLPLPVLNNGDMKKGVYDFELDKDWFKKTAPYLKLVTTTLSLVLPVASSALQVANDAATKALQDQIGLGKDVIDAIAGEGTALNEFSSVIDSADIERGVRSRAENATLRELHALLKAKDPGFGSLVRVLNKRNEFLWVHEKFAGEY